MNSYLNELSRLLANSISPDEFNNVMQYYTEYFADAGIEKQDEVIKELGTPEDLANKIIAEYNSRPEDVSTSEVLSAGENVYDEAQSASTENVLPQISTTENVTTQAAPRPRRRLAAGWIVLIVIGGILVSIPIIVSCIKKITRNVENVLSKIVIVEQEYMTLDEFDRIEVDASIADVEIVMGDEYAIEYVLGEDSSVNLNGSTLVIEDESFINHISSNVSNLKNTYVKIYVPEDEEIDIEISVDVGNVNIEGVVFNDVNIDTDTGNINIEADSEDGSIYIGADVGNVNIKGYLACDIEIEADLGKVNITSYYASTSYSYNIDTDLGKESISDEGGEELEEEYDIDVIADMGNVKIVFCDN